jgi:excisionase family DNA binding protein
MRASDWTNNPLSVRYPHLLALKGRKPMKENRINSNLGWTLEELAQSLSVSVPFLRLEIKRGRLLAARLGRRVVLLDSEVRRYLAKRPTAALAPK